MILKHLGLLHSTRQGGLFSNHSKYYYLAKDYYISTYLRINPVNMRSDFSKYRLRVECVFKLCGLVCVATLYLDDLLKDLVDYYLEFRSN